MIPFKAIFRFIHSNPPRSIGAFLLVTAVFLYTVDIISSRLAFLFVVSGYVILYLVGPSYYRKKEERLQDSIEPGDYRLLVCDTDYAKLELYESVLSENGIDSMLIGKELGEMPWNTPATTAGVKLLVRQKDFKKAREILDL